MNNLLRKVAENIVFAGGFTVNSIGVYQNENSEKEVYLQPNQGIAFCLTGLRTPDLDGFLRAKLGDNTQ